MGLIAIKLIVWRLGVPSSFSLKGLKKMIFIAVVFFFDPTLALPEFCVSSVEEEEEFQKNETQKRFIFVLFRFTA